jgi:hypothetical protein
MTEIKMPTDAEVAEHPERPNVCIVVMPEKSVSGASGLIRCAAIPSSFDPSADGHFPGQSP